MREVNVSGETSNFDENQGEEAQPLKTTQIVQTASQSWCERLRLFTQTTSQSKPPDKSENFRISIEDMFKTENMLQGEVLQDQRSFEKLIQDAEFINDAFQEWVSSWLSSGPDLHAVQKYFYPPTETFSPEDIENCFYNLSHKLKPGGKTMKSASENRSEKGGSDQDAINGKRVRGPLKHIDRAIAKVSALFSTSTYNIAFRIQYFSRLAAENSCCLSHSNTTGLPCVPWRFQEVDGHCEMLPCCRHTSRHDQSRPSKCQLGIFTSDQ
jgi:hypothetical protein